MWLPVLRKRRQRSVDEAPAVNTSAGITAAEGGDWSEPRSPRSPSLNLPSSPLARMPIIPTWGELSEAKAERITRFKQQNLKSFTLTFSPKLVLSIYFVVALICIPIGAAILAGSSQIGTTDQIEYSSKCALNTKTCRIQFNVPKVIAPPSYLYYVVTNMHQNYLSYAKSRSWRQLRGQTPKTISDVVDCFPALYIPSLRENIFESIYKERAFNESEIVNPAGLTAESFFNDTLELEGVELIEKDIAWKIDREDMFRPGNTPHYTRNPETNQLLQNEHFMVWMRLAAFSNVEKLYARIESPLEPGNYTMRIGNYYNTTAFKGEKLFFIANTQWFGAKNIFLGILFIVTGLASLLIALTVLALHVLFPRKPAFFDPDLLKRELAKLNLEKDAN